MLPPRAAGVLNRGQEDVIGYQEHFHSLGQSLSINNDLFGLVIGDCIRSTRRSRLSNLDVCSKSVGASSKIYSVSCDSANRVHIRLSGMNAASRGKPTC
jgi:hypothetical protein